MHRRPDVSARVRYLLAGLGVMSARGAAAQQPQAQPVAAVTIPATALPVSRFRQRDESFSQYSGLTDSVRVVIRDSSTWRHYWQVINRPFLPSPPLPAVDFKRELVVLASMGVRPTAGFEIRIEGGTVEASRMVVFIRRVAPGSGCAVAAVVTQPVDIVRLPATSADIWFAERLERSDCQSP